MLEQLLAIETREEKNAFIASLPRDQKDQLLSELKLAAIQPQK